MTCAFGFHGSCFPSKPRVVGEGLRKGTDGFETEQKVVQTGEEKEIRTPRKWGGGWVGGGVFIEIAALSSTSCNACGNKKNAKQLLSRYVILDKFCCNFPLPTLWLPRVIHFNFLVQSLTRDRSHSMKNLETDYFLRWKLIKQVFLITLLNHFFLCWSREFALWAWDWKG